MKKKYAPEIGISTVVIPRLYYFHINLIRLCNRFYRPKKSSSRRLAIKKPKIAPVFFK